MKSTKGSPVITYYSVISTCELCRCNTKHVMYSSTDVIVFNRVDNWGKISDFNKSALRIN